MYTRRKLKCLKVNIEHCIKTEEIQTSEMIHVQSKKKRGQGTIDFVHVKFLVLNAINLLYIIRHN